LPLFDLLLPPAYTAFGLGGAGVGFVTGLAVVFLAVLFTGAISFFFSTLGDV